MAKLWGTIERSAGVEAAAPSGTPTPTRPTPLGGTPAPTPTPRNGYRPDEVIVITDTDHLEAPEVQVNLRRLSSSPRRFHLFRVKCRQDRDDFQPDGELRTTEPITIPRIVNYSEGRGKRGQASTRTASC